ncbi:MAG TPA: hypothetical protein VK636_20475 [Gemmatimonadaceae bacterium]|nr:hypothetical protein [Gemmatimonadaceae bacterium]
MKMLKYAVGCAAIAGIAACASPGTVSSSSGEIAPVVPANGRTIPAGTVVKASLNQPVGTRSSHVGDAFSATVSDAVVAGNGETVIPSGAVIHGHVTGLHTATIPTEQSAIRLNFDSLSVNGQNYPFAANVSNVSAKSSVDRPSATRGAVTGAAAGAVLGAIISGGELSKILTGGLLGAAAGTVISLGSGDGEASIAAGTPMTLSTTNTVALR